MLVRCRRNYHKGGDTYISFWSKFTLLWKRLYLFLLTISYMPVARAILENFAGEYDADVLRNNKCVYKDGKGIPCCLKAMPQKPCLGSDDFDGLQPLQGVAIAFIFLHVIGLPIFFWFMVRIGVRRVRFAAALLVSVLCGQVIVLSLSLSLSLSSAVPLLSLLSPSALSPILSRTCARSR
jgi:hypothetical protein